MDPTHNKSDEMERRVSVRSSRRISVDGGDANDASDDDYGMVADGFRPMQPSYGTVPSIQTFPSPSTTAAATERSASSSPSPVPAGRPSSIAKPHRPHDSISLRHDGAMGPIHETTGPTRSSSISTTSSPYIPTDSPYQGPSGPSHPYQMYPQNVRLARTMSTATSSTAPVSEVSYTGPRGPTHPYGLYNQGTVVDTAALPVTSVPLGFHGLPDQYQRRIGPDGEDVADIIGPDGHTEQLPPYTRYPDDALPQKVVEAADPATPAVQGGAIIVPTTTANALPTLTTVAPAIPGAGGIGLASRNPEFDSEEELGTPRSRHSSRSFNSDVSHHEINTAAAEASEKRRPLTGWQAWMRRRVGGIIPFWAICLTALVLLLMGAILGSVIGTFMSKHKKPPRKDIYPDPMLPSATTTYDATAIPTPTAGLAPLPTGNFSMPLMVPTRSSNTCFNDTTQSKAWGCYFSAMTGMYMTIDKQTANKPGEYTFSLHCNQSLTLAANFYSYGEQPPQISQPLTLELVTDILEPTRGPAWFKMMPYNKTMILPEAVLSSTGSSSVSAQRIRDLAPRNDGRKDGSRMGDFKRKGVAEQGDKPWICNWPDTYLEVFIYPDQNASPNPFGQPPPSSSSSSSTSSTSSQQTPPPSTSGSASSQTTASTSTTLDPERRESTPPSSTPSSSSSSYSKWDGTHGGYNNDNKNHGYEEHTVGARTADPPPSSSSAYPTNGPPLGEMPRPSYPKALKLEERRVYGAPMPQCTQVEIQGPGQPAKPVRDSSGNVVTIDIVETSPEGPSSTQAQSDLQTDVGRRAPDWDRDRGSLKDRDNDADVSKCGCMWFIT
ncbi:hypothetical protein B0T19DRAFT_139126 [Cercophora scortea]|uniref:DUF7820 domain-containing protein n=1 Tax=Cercophora scortea TaxID=314031 RepID=A0AAE0IZF9_9PEZI|nr:hypothetical protein B0T19DRAFT_139126 [Cercophora scortea]